METPFTQKREVYRFDGSLTKIVTEVVTEYALTITINGDELATLVCTPDQIEQLVVGFLASEGIVRTYADIKDITFDERNGFCHVELHENNTINPQFYNKRYITSCCGKGRQSYYFYNDAHTAKRITSTTRVSMQQIFRLMQQLQDQSATFRLTGGVHNASLCHNDQLLITRTDIGRHNALDKIYGYMLQNLITTENKIIVFSGRISSEILLKVSKIGVGIILSKSAPSELALQMAEELGITVVGFIRGETCNIYTHPQRISDLANEM